ncbi:hypothetical protein NPIL_442211 [Nephila pilipes]|uniref:TF-B3 domain-containing protein n=1 Tax=Nephila pilipes TaxID=299642 RepID=A0A8X6MZF9_NEPPI|nr:hypothetical protein NPIL_442211 [Nephila pilipes]
MLFWSVPDRKQSEDSNVTTNRMRLTSGWMSFVQHSDFVTGDKCQHNSASGTNWSTLQMAEGFAMRLSCNIRFLPATFE